MSLETFCPNCGEALTPDESAAQWCPHCGAPLQTAPVVASFWKSAATTIVSCMTLLFGVLGPCALVIYGGWRFSQTHIGALVVGALVVIIVLAHVIGVIGYFFRKP